MDLMQTVLSFILQKSIKTVYWNNSCMHVHVLAFKSVLKQKLNMLLIKAIKSAQCIKNSLGSTCTNIKMTNGLLFLFFNGN